MCIQLALPSAEGSIAVATLIRKGLFKWSGLELIIPLLLQDVRLDIFVTPKYYDLILDDCGISEAVAFEICAIQGNLFPDGLWVS